MWNMTRKKETNRCKKQSYTRFDGIGNGEGICFYCSTEPGLPFLGKFSGCYGRGFLEPKTDGLKIRWSLFPYSSRRLVVAR